MRMCPKCGRVLSEANFYIRRDKGTYQSWCIDCCKAHGRLRNGTTGIYKKQENMDEINYNGIIVRIETITPYLAEQYLGKNTRNRNVNQRIVLKYANDIEKGFWNFDGAPIRFSNDGTLLDGQHRLHAIIKSGKSIDLLVVRGLAQETQATMDIGSMRQASDFFQMNGIKHATTVSAMIRGYLVKLYGSTQIHSDGKTKGFSLSNVACNRSISSMAIIDEYNSKPELYNEIAASARSLGKKSYGLLNGSVIGSFICYLHINKKYDILYICKFFSEILGITNTTNQTCRLLYDRLMKQKNEKNYMLSGKNFTALLVKTFNCYVESKELKVLKTSDVEYGIDFKQNPYLEI